MQARIVADGWQEPMTRAVGGTRSGIDGGVISGMIEAMKIQPLTMYGIPNCDTVKKARLWLAGHSVEYQFHDFKKQGLPLAQVGQWIKVAGYDKLLNRRGPTWRKLDAAVQASVVDQASAVAVMQLNSSVIKRPVVQWPNGQITVGFDPVLWRSLAGL